jgi:hypothetical protein
MESRKNIEKYFNSDRESLDYINKYEENKIFFNELLSTGRKEDLEFVLPIKIYKYAQSLNQTGYYSKSLEVIDEIELDLKKILGISNRHKQLNESIIFIRGVCFGRLKKYRRSNVEFKKLLKINPVNDRYIEWYKSNLTSILDNYIKLVVASSFALFAVTAILDLLKIKLPSYINTISLIILLISSSLFMISAKIITRIFYKFTTNASS